MWCRYQCLPWRRRDLQATQISGAKTARVWGCGSVRPGFGCTIRTACLSSTIRALSKGDRAMRIFIVVIALLLLSTFVVSSATLDNQLAAVLAEHGFTGRIETTLEPRLGRKLDNQLLDLGRLLFFDTVGGLNNDNNCSGCHSPK